MKALFLLGANLGDRAANLRRAVAGMSEWDGCRVRAVSRIYETAPIGPSERPYLNQAVRLETTRSPMGLLIEAKNLEAAAGRKAGVRWGARPLDVDVVACDSLRVRTPWLEVPHPRAAERAFALLPLADVAAGWKPDGKRTIHALLRALNPNPETARLWSKLLIVLCLLRPGLVRAQVEYVDPTIGGIGHLLEPTRPTVHLPYGMVRVYPLRKDQTDDQIRGFPLTIVSHRLGELFWLMPGSDAPAAYDQERTTPYYYSARLDGSLTTIEFAPSRRCGYFRFTFPSGTPAVLLANNPSDRLSGELRAAGDHAVGGYEYIIKKDMKVYVYGEFSAPVSIVKNGDENKTRLTATARGGRKTLEFRYGISFISEEQAEKNLREEIPAWDFEAVKNKDRLIWNDALGRIAVEGGTGAQKRVFYTALYRCHERMVNITEDGRYYSNFDHRVHADLRPFYVDNWLWDTYQALEPLDMLLDPDMEADKIQSYVRMYEQGGEMPSFAVLWGIFPAMTGNHAAAWMADAWFKGIRGFDLPKAYEGLRKKELAGTLLPWRSGPKVPLDDFYAAHGYFPALRPGEKETEPLVDEFERRQAVSVTLAHSYDAWNLAQLARALGKDADSRLFLKNAGNYANVYRADKGFMWPRDSTGAWIEPFDPKIGSAPGGRDYFTENNGYTYNWDVKHDLKGLFGLMGGPKAAERKLDQLFREDLGRDKQEFWALLPDSTGMVGQFSMGNEPSFPIPYLYDFTGSPWKTQKRIRMLLETWFTDTALGIPGDEDGGGMSSFVVFSMMGFYPVVPGIPAYSLGSPVFDQVTVRLKGGKTLRIVCKNNSRDNKYIQDFRLNGKPMTQVWFRHADVADGGTLELEMGDTPNPALGSNSADFPPSEMSFDPKTIE